MFDFNVKQSLNRYTDKHKGNQNIVMKGQNLVARNQRYYYFLASYKARGNLFFFISSCVVLFVNTLNCMMDFNET